MTFAPRSLEDLARENAVEGCTLETFGALVGLAQAETATDTAIRRVMRGIARDEARHGELAWRVHHRALARLDAEAAERVRRAAEDTARTLMDPSGEPLDATTARALGVPVGPERRALARSFVDALPTLAAHAGGAVADRQPS